MNLHLHFSASPDVTQEQAMAYAQEQAAEQGCAVAVLEKVTPLLRALDPLTYDGKQSLWHAICVRRPVQEEGRQR